MKTLAKGKQEEKMSSLDQKGRKKYFDEDMDVADLDLTPQSQSETKKERQDSKIDQKSDEKS